jgi:hypothetical protein
VLATDRKELPVMVRLVVDFENTSRRWWESGGQDLWDTIREDFDTNEVLLEESIARSWLAEAEKVPGWDDGHEYAPHPIRISPVEDDEEL